MKAPPKAISKTTRDGTMTAQGYIRHRPHPAGFDMPVRLLRPGTDVRAGLAGYLHPLRDGKGRLVFALPGGGEWFMPDEEKDNATQATA